MFQKLEKLGKLKNMEKAEKFGKLKILQTWENCPTRTRKYTDVEARWPFLNYLAFL